MVPGLVPSWQAKEVSIPFANFSIPMDLDALKFSKLAFHQPLFHLFPSEKGPMVVRCGSGMTPPAARPLPFGCMDPLFRKPCQHFEILTEMILPFSMSPRIFGGNCIYGIQNVGLRTCASNVLPPSPPNEREGAKIERTDRVFLHELRMLGVLFHVVSLARTHPASALEKEERM
jgi:hypothetical protein